jgi:SSS family solute:Na+ symporter
MNNSAAIVDIAVFFGFLIAVLVIAFIMGRRTKKKDGTATEDYFLAGRGLAWWLIGISLISANISAEQFVGMSGQAAMYVGLAIASFEWIAAVSLVFVAFIFLPRFLKAGVYTVPQFLETRYNRLCRTLMSLSLLLVYAFVTIVAVNYAGAKAFSGIFGGQTYFGVELNLVTFSWLLGFFAAVYVLYGGLKSAAWAGSLQGTALILCGAIVLL